MDQTTNAKKIGQKIKKLRKKNKLTQKQIADFLDSNQTYISKIEQGKKNININSLEKIANLFGYSINYFTNKNNKNHKYDPIKQTLKLYVKNITNEDLKVMENINKIAINIFESMTELIYNK
jgi:transcriptional regulator with XRE-family HTH domain